MASALEMHAIENMIADFIQDTVRQSMEFPTLTAAQRKHAKVVLEGYPELSCESYGFGKERKLNVFKKGSSTNTRMNIMDMVEGDAASMVKVKNTFIDDWTKPEKESFILRSMPAHLPTNSVQCFMDGPVCKLDLSSINKCSDSECSTIVPSSCTSDNGSPQSTFRVLPDWLSPPPGLEVEVKNTFVHFAAPSADERAVQSMPRSMFRKCLLLESLLADSGQDSVKESLPLPVHAQQEKQHLEEVSPNQAHNHDVNADSALMTGDEVVIQGLAKCPAFNGLEGTVQSFNIQSGRYSVLLSSPIDGNKTAMLKRENCQLIPFRVGTEVAIEGLSKCPAFNGLQGKVQYFDVQSGRYKVLLLSSEFEHKTAMLKRENCRSLSFAVGTEVVIEGLSKYPVFNGLRGTVQSFDGQSERYSILLSSPVQGCKATKVKRKNLRLASSKEGC